MGFLGDFWGEFGIFSSPLLILGFVLEFPGWSEQEVLISCSKEPAAAYKIFRSGQVVEVVAPCGWERTLLLISQQQRSRCGEST